jgi:hypothetical protein
MDFHHSEHKFKLAGAMNPVADGKKIPGIEDITDSTATFYSNTVELSSFHSQTVGYWLQTI